MEATKDEVVSVAPTPEHWNRNEQLPPNNREYDSDSTNTFDEEDDRGMSKIKPEVQLKEETDGFVYKPDPRGHLHLQLVRSESTISNASTGLQEMTVPESAVPAHVPREPAELKTEFVQDEMLGPTPGHIRNPSDMGLPVDTAGDDPRLQNSFSTAVGPPAIMGYVGPQKFINESFQVPPYNGYTGYFKQCFPLQSYSQIHHNQYLMPYQRENWEDSQAILPTTEETTSTLGIGGDRAAYTTKMQIYGQWMRKDSESRIKKDFVIKKEDLEVDAPSGVVEESRSECDAVPCGPCCSDADERCGGHSSCQKLLRSVHSSIDDELSNEITYNDSLSSNASCPPTEERLKLTESEEYFVESAISQGREEVVGLREWDGVLMIEKIKEEHDVEENQDSKMLTEAQRKKMYRQRLKEENPEMWKMVKERDANRKRMERKKRKNIMMEMQLMQAEDNQWEAVSSDPVAAQRERIYREALMNEYPEMWNKLKDFVPHRRNGEDKFLGVEVMRIGSDGVKRMRVYKDIIEAERKWRYRQKLKEEKPEMYEKQKAMDARRKRLQRLMKDVKMIQATEIGMKSGRLHLDAIKAERKLLYLQKLEEEDVVDQHSQFKKERDRSLGNGMEKQMTTRDVLIRGEDGCSGIVTKEGGIEGENCLPCTSDESIVLRVEKDYTHSEGSLCSAPPSSCSFAKSRENENKDKRICESITSEEQNTNVVSCVTSASTPSSMQSDILWFWSDPVASSGKMASSAERLTPAEQKRVYRERLKANPQLWRQIKDREAQKKREERMKRSEEEKEKSKMISRERTRKYREELKKNEESWKKYKAYLAQRRREQRQNLSEERRIKLLEIERQRSKAYRMKMKTSLTAENGGEGPIENLPRVGVKWELCNMFPYYVT